jgi:hypothetical protein
MRQDKYCDNSLSIARLNIHSKWFVSQVKYNSVTVQLVWWVSRSDRSSKPGPHRSPRLDAQLLWDWSAFAAHLRQYISLTQWRYVWPSRNKLWNIVLIVVFRWAVVTITSYLRKQLELTRFNITGVVYLTAPNRTEPMASVQCFVSTLIGTQSWNRSQHQRLARASRTGLMWPNWTCTCTFERLF